MSWNKQNNVVRTMPTYDKKRAKKIRYYIFGWKALPTRTRYHDTIIIVHENVPGPSETKKNNFGKKY